MQTRREFLRKGAFAILALGTTPVLVRLSGGLGLEPAQLAAAAARKKSDRVLVVLQLSGGNDGLNTVIPYGESRYYDLRKGLAIATGEVLPLDRNIGLHPSLAPLKELYDKGALAVVQGVGYPNHNRSHFRSMEIWQTAAPDKFKGQGWLGVYLDHTRSTDDSPLKAMSLGGAASRTLAGDQAQVAVVQSLAAFQFRPSPRYPRERDRIMDSFAMLRSVSEGYSPAMLAIGSAYESALASTGLLQERAKAYEPQGDYPRGPYGDSLKLAAQVIAADLETQVLNVTLGGFDHHANEKNQHANLLATMAKGMAAFYSDLEALGKTDSVLLMAFSEFGRRAQENGAAGTDHARRGQCSWSAAPWRAD